MKIGNVIAFAPEFNTGKKRDATGAFQPEAESFVEIHGGKVVLINNRTNDESMRNTILDHLRDNDFTSVAFFCHGLGKRIQFGFDTANVEDLAEAIIDTPYSPPGPVVPLYACSTARDLMGQPVGGDGGFADALRDALCIYGGRECVVDAHTTAGHATKNPYVRRFEGRGSPVGGVGGSYIVQPGSLLWKRWVSALRYTDLRFRFPFMTIGQIHTELDGSE